MKTANLIAIGALLASLLMWAASAWGSYGHNDTDLKQRLTVVETKQLENERRLERMEQKIDRLLERVQ